MTTQIKHNKFNINISRILILSFLAIFLTLSNPTESYAQSGQTIGTIVDNFFSQGHLFSVSKFLEAIAYILGCVAGYKAFNKFYEWNESKGRQAKVTTGIVWLLAAGFLFGLPTVIKYGHETFLGVSANQSFSGQYGGSY